MAITVKENIVNQAGISAGEPTTLGGCVIRSDRGVLDPVYIGGGNINLLRLLFGGPSKKYPDLAEVGVVVGSHACTVQRAIGGQFSCGAVAFVKTDVGGVETPVIKSLFGGIRVVKSFDEIKSGLDPKKVPVRIPFEYSFVGGKHMYSIKVKTRVEAGSVVSVDFLSGDSLSDLIDEDDRKSTLSVISRDALKDVSSTVDVKTGLVISDPRNKIAVDGIDYTVEEVVKSKYVFSFVLDKRIPEEFSLFFDFEQDMSKDVYYLLVSKLVGDNTVKIFMKAGDDLPEIEILGGKDLFVSTYFSLDPDRKNSFGNNVYIEKVLEKNMFVELKDVGAASLGGKTKEELLAMDTALVPGENFVVGFSRTQNGKDVGVSDILDGWEKLNSDMRYVFDVFFTPYTPSSEAEAKQLHAGVKERTAKSIVGKYADIIVTTSSGAGIKANDVDTLKAYASGMVKDRRISCYHSNAYIIDSFTGLKLLSNLSGDIALGRLNIHEQAVGAEAQAMGNEGGLGGQITSGRVDELFDTTLATAPYVEKNFGDVGINPIIRHPIFGYTILTRRTTVSKNDIFLYIERVTVLLKFIRFAVTSVLPYYESKKVTRARRLSLYTSLFMYLNQLRSDGNLYNFVINMGTDVNTPDVLARDEFIIKVGVQYMPFMSHIFLEITSASINADLEDIIGKSEAV